MTASEKINWINEKVTILVDKIHELETKNRALSNNATIQNGTLQKDLEAAKKQLEEKDKEIEATKEQLTARDAEIDEVVKKIDLLLGEN